MGKLSEYNRAYSGQSDNAKYLENRRYCYDRRQREQRHTPICWEGESSDEEEVSPELANLVINDKPIKNNKILEDRQCNNGHSSVSNRSDETCVKVLNDESAIKRCRVKILSPKRKSPNYRKASDSRSPPKRPRPPYSKVKNSKNTSTSSKPQPRRQRIMSPFVAYGCEYDTDHIGRKLTHNVKASADVQLSALKAQRRLLAEKRLHRDIKLKVRNPKSHEVNDKLSESSGWVSEYQLRFPAYDTAVYAKHMPQKRHLLLS